MGRFLLIRRAAIALMVPVMLGVGCGRLGYDEIAGRGADDASEQVGSDAGSDAGVVLDASGSIETPDGGRELPVAPDLAFLFDEGAGVWTRSSDGALAGELGSAARWLPSGVYGGAVAFGNQPEAVITFAADPRFQLRSSMTIAVWIRLPSGPLASGCTVLGICGGANDGSSATNALWALRLQEASLTWYQESGTHAGIDAGGPSFPGDDSWHHVTAVRDAAASTMRFFVDGAPSTQTALSAAPEDGSASPMYVGSDAPDGCGLGAAIELDELLLFARALSEAEVYAIYERTRTR